MPLNWDDDDITEVISRRRKRRALVHDEITEVIGPPMQNRLNPDAEEITLNLRQTPKPKVPPGNPAIPSVVKPNPGPGFKPSPEPETMPTQVKILNGLHPAALRDRWVAWILDTLVTIYLYCFSSYFLQNLAPELRLDFTQQGFLEWLQKSPEVFALYLGLFVGIHLVYFILFEAIFGASLGKFFCRLRVVEEKRTRARVANVIMRNLLRVVDYPLFFLVAVISMEASKLHQRFGDRAARTVVIKKRRGEGRRLDLTQTPLASTFSRILAGLIDLTLALSLAYSLILLIDVQRPLYSQILIASIPLVLIFYYSLLELMGGTTPGKALFRRQVILVNGEHLDGSSAILRNLFRPLDLLLAYPLMVLSPRKQRLGDMVADTLVVVHANSKKGLVTSLLALLLIGSVAFLGYQNPNNSVREAGLSPIEGLQFVIPQVLGPFKSLAPRTPIQDQLSPSAPKLPETAPIPQGVQRLPSQPKVVSPQVGEEAP